MQTHSCDARPDFMNWGSGKVLGFKYGSETQTRRKFLHLVSAPRDFDFICQRSDMPPRSGMSILVFLFVCLGYLSSPSSAQSTTDVIYTGRTSTCTSAWDLGQAIFCCNGACIDGTGDEDPTGLCKYFADGCNDPITPPACASLDQVFVFDNFNGVDTGIGNCYYWCTWGQFNYSWSCCDCPQGYTAVASTCAELTLPNSYECMGCPPGFALTVNLSPSGGYFCSDETLHSVLCDLGRDVKSAFDIAGRVSIGEQHATEEGEMVQRGGSMWSSLLGCLIRGNGRKGY